MSGWFQAIHARRRPSGESAGCALGPGLGLLALSGVIAESMVHDIGWTMLDIGKRIERAQVLTALLRATLE